MGRNGGTLAGFGAMNVVASLLLAGILAGSWWGTGVVLRYAKAKSVLDVPNERSSHTTPTPRGGGLALCVMILGGIVIGWAGGWIERGVALALLPSAAAVAAVSWQEDRRGVPAGVRFLVHVVAAAWVVHAFGPVISFGSAANASLGVLGFLLTLLGVVWVVNLFNFMDGIDGIGAGQAVTVGLIAALLCWRAGDRQTAWLSASLAMGALGFLRWNWPPARVFLGDVGSVFLGFMLAAVGILAAQRGDIPLTGWMLLMGVFLVDATVTLLRRIARRERWFAPHRSHAYQRAVQAGWSHGAVSGAVMTVNFALGALVWLAVSHPRSAGLAYAAGLVLLIAWYLRAEREHPM